MTASSATMGNSALVRSKNQGAQNRTGEPPGSPQDEDAAPSREPPHGLGGIVFWYLVGLALVVAALRATTPHAAFGLAALAFLAFAFGCWRPGERMREVGRTWALRGRWGVRSAWILIVRDESSYGEDDVARYRQTRHRLMEQNTKYSQDRFDYLQYLMLARCFLTLLAPAAAFGAFWAESVPFGAPGSAWAPFVVVIVAIAALSPVLGSLGDLVAYLRSPDAAELTAADMEALDQENALRLVQAEQARVLTRTVKSIIRHLKNWDDKDFL